MLRSSSKELREYEDLQRSLGLGVWKVVDQEGR